MSRVSSFHLSPRRCVAVFSAVCLLLCLASCFVLNTRHSVSLLEAANKIGPTAQSLVTGHGLTVCYGADSLGCVHGQRMPLAPVTVAVLYLLFGQHTLLAALVKTLVFLLPVILSFALAAHSVQAASTQAKWITLGLFVLAIFLPPLLTTAANLNFEEAFFYSWLALAVALLLFPAAWRAHPLRWSFMLWLSLALTYLTKSSMMPATGFLAVAAVFLVVRVWRRPALAAALLIACVSVPLAWATWQQRTSGRFTAGTSLDGVNLYKGNNPGVPDLYPAFRGASLDATEASLFAGSVALDSDWAENDFASARTLRYIRSHPAATLRLDVRKATVFFLGVQRNLGEDPYPRLMELAFDLGLFVFRLMLLTAIALAIRNLLTRPGQRFRAVVFLGCVVSTAIPYVIGFALTRHSLVLILPTAAYLASLFATIRDV